MHKSCQSRAVASRSLCHDAGRFIMPALIMVSVRRSATVGSCQERGWSKLPELFEESELATELAARGIRGETHRVILRVSETIAHGRMVDAMDTLDAANIYTIIEVVSE